MDDIDVQADVDTHIQGKGTVPDNIAACVFIDEEFHHQVRDDDRQIGPNAARRVGQRVRIRDAAGVCHQALGGDLTTESLLEGVKLVDAARHDAWNRIAGCYICRTAVEEVPNVGANGRRVVAAVVCQKLTRWILQERQNAQGHILPWEVIGQEGHKQAQGVGGQKATERAV